MKKALLAVAALTCVSSAAMAGVNAGGTLIVALSEGTVYTSDIADYCGSATVQDCGSAVATYGDTDTVVLNVIAAFNPSGAPRLAGVTFGIAYNDAEVFMNGWGPCGDFELATGGWPGSGEGTAVTWGTAQESALTEVYWFAAYNYYGTPNSLCLGEHPTQGANFADDSVPSELDGITGLGCFGFSTAGEAPCPDVQGVGACCYGPDDCADGLTQAGCEDGGGVYGGDGSACTDPGFCEALPTGACCLEDGSCANVDRDTCEGLGGVYQGDGTDCDTTDCTPTPTIESSWGEVKALYR